MNDITWVAPGRWRLYTKTRTICCVCLLRDVVDEAVLRRSIKIVAESLARHMFNLTRNDDLDIFSDALVRRFSSPTNFYLFIMLIISIYTSFLYCYKCLFSYFPMFLYWFLIPDVIASGIQSLVCLALLLNICSSSCTTVNSEECYCHHSTANLIKISQRCTECQCESW